MYMHNTTVHASTGYMPFELVYGFRSTLPLTLHETPSPQYNYDDYVLELKSRPQTEHEVAKEKLLKTKQKSKEYYDRRAEKVELNIGDRVLLFDETVRRGRSRKLSSQWIGPYEVLGIDKVNVLIKRGRKVQKVHINRLKPF
jgi:hypothetical protein